MLRAKRAGKFENEFNMVKAFVKKFEQSNQNCKKVLVGRKPNPDPMDSRDFEGPGAGPGSGTREAALL